MHTEPLREGRETHWSRELKELPAQPLAGHWANWRLKLPHVKKNIDFTELIQETH